MIFCLNAFLDLGPHSLEFKWFGMFTLLYGHPARECLRALASTWPWFHSALRRQTRKFCEVSDFGTHWHFCASILEVGICWQKSSEFVLSLTFTLAPFDAWGLQIVGWTSGYEGNADLQRCGMIQHSKQSQEGMWKTLALQSNEVETGGTKCIVPEIQAGPRSQTPLTLWLKYPKSHT